MLFAKLTAILFCLTITIQLGTGQSFGSTNVQGPIFTDAIWDQTGSPYVLTGNFQIPKNVTLTILPGTQVVFNGDFQILIKGGRLNIEGSRSKPVEFFGNVAGKAMILFKSSDLSISSITHCKFNGPKAAIQLAEEQEHSQDTIKNWNPLQVTSITLSDSTIQTNGYESTASLRINEAIVDRSIIVGVYPSSEPITISNSIVTSSTIHSDSYNKGIRIQSTTIINSTMMMGCCGANIALTDSRMTQVAVREGFGSPVNGPFQLDQCTANGFSIDLPSAKIIVKSSRLRFTDNQNMKVGTANINCSIIAGDKTQVGIEITGRNGYYTTSDPQQIVRSSISNFITGVSVAGEETSLTIDQSNFINNDQYNLYVKTPKDVVATNNFWGTSSLDRSQAKIYDFYQDIDFGKVLADPIASTKIDNQIC